MSEQLIAAYAASAQQDQADAWVKLWQRPFSKEVQQAGIEDLTAMWYMVLSGLSARLYRASSCPAGIDAEGVVSVPLDFYVFPSALDLGYSLSTAGPGEIGPGLAIEEPREFDLVFDQSDSMDLGYLARQVQYAWQSEAYDGFGRQLPRPQVSHEGGQIKLSASCTCVLRIKCQAQGYRHRLTMRLQKYEPVEDEAGEVINWTGYKIENIKTAVQVTWMDGGELKSESLDLAIPPCVEDYLALCEDGTLKGIFNLNPGDGWRTLLYYSTCTGNKLGVRKVKVKNG